METVDLLTRAMPILAAAESGGDGAVPGQATRLVSDLAADWLRGHGHGSAWDAYSSDPRNDSLVKHLLTEAVQQDQHFKAQFDKAVDAALAERAQPPSPIRQTINLGTGEAQIGNRGDSITGGRVASRGGTYQETHNRTTKKGSPAAGIIALVVAVILIILIVKGIGALLSHVASPGLTASSTCQQFLNADEQTEQQALTDIAGSMGIGGFGSPLALPEIRYECSFQPTMTLGAIIRRDRNVF